MKTERPPLIQLSVVVLAAVSIGTLLGQHYAAPFGVAGAVLAPLQWLASVVVATALMPLMVRRGRRYPVWLGAQGLGMIWFAIVMNSGATVPVYWTSADLSHHSGASGLIALFPYTAVMALLMALGGAAGWYVSAKFDD